MSAVALLAATFTAACALTWAMRRYALARRILDVPNARSSHSVPTPRGGGVAIVLAATGGLLALALLGSLPPRLASAWCGAGAVVAIIGFIDDHRHVSAAVRLLAHFSAAAWLILVAGGTAPLDVLGGVLPEGGDLVVAILGVVWLINLTNFMDGIDGLAGIEAATVCLGGAVLLAGRSGAVTAALPPLVLAAAALGFLVWNWPPARIFMGDAGSGFMGLLLAAFALFAGTVDARLFWSWTILLGVFITDATVTLLRRLGRGERVHEAHRSHAYQHSARRLGRHGPVSLAVAAINLAWLLPLAWLVAAGTVSAAVGLLAAYLPLVTLALWLRAGIPDHVPA